MLLYSGPQDDDIIQSRLLRRRRAQEHKKAEKGHRNNSGHAGGDDAYRHPSRNTDHIPAVIPFSIDKKYEKGRKKQPYKSKGGSYAGINHNDHKINRTRRRKGKQDPIYHIRCLQSLQGAFMAPPSFSGCHKPQPADPALPRGSAWDGVRSPERCPLYHRCPLPEPPHFCRPVS